MAARQTGGVSQVVATVRGISGLVMNSQRLLEIGRVMARHGFADVVERVFPRRDDGKPLLADESVSLPPHVQSQSTAERIRKVIEELGATFIKLGQILSTRTDIVNHDICLELQKLQDEVPEMQRSEVRTIVERELAGKLEDLFASFEEAPLACASIAQVHVAKLRSTMLPDGTLEEGADVVVKIQRPNLLGRIEHDLQILEFLARRAQIFLPEIALMDPYGIVQEFSKALRKELDFTNERTNMVRFTSNFSSYPFVQIPRVYHSHCTARVLTMQRLPGVKITLATERFGIDPYLVAPRMLEVLFKMVFEDGYFHGDLHPGNILIDAEGNIGLIDFGLVGRLTEPQRDHILDILIGLSRQDYRMVSREFFDLGIKLPGVSYHYDAFEADVIEVMERHVENKTLNEIDVGLLFRDLVSGAIRHQIKMPPTYTMVFKALMTVEGIGKSLAPEINFIEQAQPFVKRILVERYSPNRLLKEGIEIGTGLSRMLRLLPGVATQLLNDASAGRLTVRVHHEDLADALHSHTVAQWRLARAVGFGACVIGSAVCVKADMPMVLGMSWLSAMMAMGALWLGLPIFFRAPR
jgi:ubiquinone biosynthesis protein